MIADDYPRYFQALEECGHISANDARNDPSTNEFNENYLKPLGITSMMDVPIVLQGKMVGIVCHEHIGPGRKWTVEEEDFANSISDLCALAIAETERKRAENNLYASEQKYVAKYREAELARSDLADFFENATIGLHWVGPDGIILRVNQHELDMLGYTNEEYIGHHISEFHDDQKIIEDILDRLGNKEILHDYEATLKCKDGSLREVLINSSVLWENDDFIHTRCFTRDVTEKRRVEEQLTFQATHDALTGLVNRREFERRAERLLSTIQQDKDEHALCFMDLDQFKVVNDSCGHVAGDEMLRQLSKILLETVRHRDTLARLGGDEFGVLMEHCSLDDAHRVATSLQKAVQDYRFSWEGQSFKVSVSMGLVSITGAIPNLTELLKEADAACFMAKDLGRNRIHVYHEDDATLTQRSGEMKWVTRIQRALDEDRFCLYAQAIVPLDNRTDKHYELLTRMIDETKNIIPPGAFLPAAERYNLITNLDRWVVEKTFTLLAAHPAFVKQIQFISINLSGQSLTDDTFLHFIIDQLEANVIQPGKICFEITETAVITNLNVANLFITKLKTFGCRFALDDFGSGLSSFAYLKNLPVDYLKIDGMFVKDITDDPIDRAMVKSINEIGQVMGMQTIAEFVENDEIKGMLKEIGVNYAQGYGIEKPMCFDELLGRSNNVTDIKNPKGDEYIL